MQVDRNQSVYDPIANFKLLLIGDSGVGKSSILLRYTHDSFELQQSATIGVDFRVKMVTLDDGKRVKLSIWDTAGQERFRTLTPSYYRGAHGAVVVFDVSKRESFDRLSNWITELNTFSNEANIVKILVGNKIDQSRQVSSEEGQRFARLHGMTYAEVSARTSEGVNHMFFTIVMTILERPELWTAAQERIHAISVGRNYSSSTNNCC